MARVTISIQLLKDEVNKMIAQSTCEPLVREGMANVLETALLKSGNYKGFRYLNEFEVPTGEKAGCYFTGPEMKVTFEGADETRRAYS